MESAKARRPNQAATARVDAAGPARANASAVASGWARGAAGRVRKASVVLAEDLRARILGEGLEPGTGLPSESEIARETGLGRATVREALRLLEADGLIVIRRGAQGGIEVSRPHMAQLTHSMASMLTLSAAPLAELVAFRRIIEPEVARLAAEHATDEQRSGLVELAGRGPDEGYANEVAFHVLLAEASGNSFVNLLLAVPHDLLHLHVGGEKITDDDVREANRAHRLVARAVADGDGARAARAMQRHLDSFRDRMASLGRLDQPIIPRERWLQAGRPWLHQSGSRWAP